MSGMRSNQFNVKCVSCIVKMKWTHWRRVPVSGIDALCESARYMKNKHKEEQKNENETKKRDEKRDT